MKKKIIAIVFLLLLATALMSACSGGIIEYVKDYDMTAGVVECPLKEITFNVASCNIQGGKLTKDKVSKMADLLNKESVNIVGVQEMDDFAKRSGKIDFMAHFSENGYNNGYFAPTNTLTMGKTYGIAVLSKTELSKKASFLLPYPYEREDKNVEKRLLTRTLTMIDGVQIAFYNAHLSYEDMLTNNGKNLRGSQIDFIIDLINSDPVPYKIVVGDFNVTSFNEYHAFTTAGLNCINTVESPFNSYRREEEFLAIDNIIYTDNLELLHSKMLNSDLSDHNPIIAGFKTKI